MPYYANYEWVWVLGIGVDGVGVGDYVGGASVSRVCSDGVVLVAVMVIEVMVIRDTT